MPATQVSVGADPNASAPATAGTAGDGSYHAVTIEDKQPAPGTEQQGKTGEGERPQWLPEKFKTAEDLASAYAAAEKKISELTAKPKADDGAAPTIQQTKDAASKAGIDLNALSAELKQNGGNLTEATMKSLEEKGFSRPMVATYINGLKAEAAQHRATLESVAGGADELTSVYEWASTNLPAGEVEAYNALIESGNVEAAKLALQGIVNRFQAANGTEPHLVNPGSGSAVPSDPPFESDAQIIAAMSDPRYATDEAYRQKVARRLQSTTALTVRGL